MVLYAITGEEMPVPENMTVLTMVDPAESGAKLLTFALKIISALEPAASDGMVNATLFVSGTPAIGPV